MENEYDYAYDYAYEYAYEYGLVDANIFICEHSIMDTTWLALILETYRNTCSVCNSSVFPLLYCIEPEKMGQSESYNA